MAEWQDGFSIRAYGTGGGRNGLREDVDRSPFASTGLTSYCASSVWWLIPSCHGSLALLSVLSVVPFPLPTVFQVPLHSLRGPTFPFVFPTFFYIGIHVTRESFFCEVTLELPNRKSCLVNNLPFVPKEYSSRQTCLCCHLCTSESRKIFPSLEAEWLW